MEDKTEASGSLPGNQGQPRTDGATVSHKPRAKHDVGGATPAPDPTSPEPEGDQMTLGLHQTQAGMRS